MSGSNKQMYFSAIASSALLIYLKGSPIFPSVRMAYAYIKSDGVLTAWNNLTHMKVETGQLSTYWQGEFVIRHTGELKHCSHGIVKDGVRAYRTLYHSFADEDMYYGHIKNRQIKRAKSPYLQTKALIKSKKEDESLVEKMNSFIQLYRLEQYDKIEKVYDKPSYVSNEEMIPVINGEELISIAFVVDNEHYISLRKVLEYQQISIEQKNGIVKMNGHIVKAFTLANLCYVNLEDLKRFLLFQVEWDQHAKVLSLF